MAHTLTQTHATARTPFTALRDWVDHPVRHMRDALARRRACANIRYELSALSDRELSDIGVRRSDIGAIAREHAYGK